MIEIIPANQREDHMRAIVGAIVEDYQADPNPDRVYVVDAPGGVIGKEIIKRAGLNPGPEVPVVWGAWTRDAVQELIHYDPSAMNLAWFASRDIKIYMMTDGLKPWFLRIPVPEPQPVRECTDRHHRVRRFSSN